MKKQLFILFFILFSVTVKAYDAKIGNIYYNLDQDSKTATVTYLYNDEASYSGNANKAAYSGNVVIPNEVTYNGVSFQVNSIGDNAFWNCYNLTSVTIPNSISYLGIRAFNSCGTLKSIIIPESVSFIGSAAFAGCTSLESISIPNGVTSISYNCFQGCSNLTAVFLPNSITEINGWAFKKCSNLTTICFSQNITSIDKTAFEDCSRLSNICVTVTDHSAFCNNKVVGILVDYLKKPIHLMNENGSEITEYIIPNDVTSIGDNAFQKCTNLTSINFSQNITSINGSAFKDCNLSTVNVTVIDYSAFCNNKVVGIAVNLLKKPIHLMNENGLEITEYNCPNDVTSIGDMAFFNCTGINSINIPTKIVSIGSSAFQNCIGLTSLEIPNSVTTIERLAFSGCSSLTSISLSNSLTSISDYVFRRCPFTNINIPNSVTTIGESAFEGCRQLNSLTFPNSITSIGSNAFKSCSSLTSINLSPNITSIGNYAFEGCDLNDINVSVTDFSAFCNNEVMKQIRYRLNKPVTLIDKEGKEIKEFNIPDGVTTIGNSAFDNCTGLISVTIPNSVTTIGEETFSGCTGFTSMNIPKNISSIGYNAFRGCNNLSSLTIHSENIGSWFSGLTSIKEVILGDEVTSIGNNAFSNCSGLTSVKIPNSVTSIDSYAFYGCNKLLSLTIGTGVTSIGQSAFENTNLKKTIWLTNTPPSGYRYASGAVNYVANEQYGSLNNKIVYPFISSLFEVDGIYYVPVSPSEKTCDAIDCKYDETMVNTIISSTVSYKGISMNVKKIQPYLCYNNVYIENLTCGNNGIIADYAFSGCTGINSVICNNNGNIGDNAFKGCTTIKTISCNNSGIIGNNAFESCSNAESLSLGKNITSICKSSFKDCSSLQAVTIPNAVTLLDDYAFSGCSSLENIQIGDHVNTIGQNTFENCKLIQTIIIPDSVKTINNNAFSGCNGLKTLIIADRESELSLGRKGSSPLFADCPLDSVYIGGNISYDTSSGSGYSPFYRNTSLRTVVITDKETEISPNEFYGCTNLENFSIGDGVTTFGDWAFSGCSSLKSLSFGSQLKTIGKEVFSDCTAVTKIYSKAATPPTCGVQALDDINKWNCTLYVPKGSLDSYQAADQWKEFFFMEEGAEVSDVNHILADDTQIFAENGVFIFSNVNEGTSIFIYSVSGQMVASTKVNGNKASLNTNIKKGEVAIVKIGEKTVKVLMQ